ncbi:MAG: SDR family oxidoreductase [Anaerolineae bacterium]
MKINVAGLKVIVTAGGSGLGNVIAKTFAENGAEVCICDISQKLLDDATRTTPSLKSWTTDVSQADQVDTFMVEAIGSMGGVDVLVNNAGIAGPGGNLEDLDEAGWKQTLDVNLTGMFLTSRRVIPHLKKQKSGSIVNIASTAGLWGFPYRAPYCASKWAIVGLTKTMAMELGEFNVQANVICPGSLNNKRMEYVIGLEMESTGRTEEEVRAGFTNQVSMKTFIDPEEIASQILYLCSPLGKNISGQAICIDGHTETMRA